MFNKKSRFTLIELIVVIAVLGILSAIVIPNIKDMNKKAEVAAVQSNIRNIQTAVDMFHLDYGYYPTDKQPEATVDKETGKVTTSKEEINFSKDDFVKKYLRSTPSTGVTYYVDGHGTVIIEGDEENQEVFIETVKLGGSHSIGIDVKGNLYSWGYNSNGELGIGTREDKYTPQKINFFSGKKIKKVELGYHHSLVLLENGEVYTWGRNTQGELGLDHTNNQTTPQQIDFFKGKNVKEVYSLRNTSYALLDNGELYSWGGNEYGLLGLGLAKNSIQTTPEKIVFPNNSNVSKIEFVNSKVICLTVDGNLYYWGLDYIGENNRPTKIERYNLEVNDFKCGPKECFANLQGNYYAWGYNGDGELGLGHQNNVRTMENNNFLKSLSELNIGWGNSFSIKPNGKVYGWGDNRYGQAGDTSWLGVVLNPTEITYFQDKEIKTIISSTRSSLALSKTGRVYSWGGNEHGELGVGLEMNHLTKAKPQEITYFQDKQIKEIYTSNNSSYAISENGEVYVWGNNSSGRLGIGNKENQNTPQKLDFFKR